MENTTIGNAVVKTLVKVNKLTGKASSAAPPFSEQNCGSHTRLYVEVIEKRDDATLHHIVEKATALIPYSMDATLEEGSCPNEDDDTDLLIAALCKLLNHCLCTLLTSSG